MKKSIQSSLLWFIGVLRFYQRVTSWCTASQSHTLAGSAVQTPRSTHGEMNALDELVQPCLLACDEHWEWCFIHFCLPLYYVVSNGKCNASWPPCMFCFTLNRRLWIETWFAPSLWLTQDSWFGIRSWWLRFIIWYQLIAISCAWLQVEKASVWT